MRFFTFISKDLFLGAFEEICYFPIWWYSRGLKKAAFFCWQRIRAGWQALALSILLANFFKPMYGETGWSAYLLSLAARFWQISWRGLLILLWFGFWLLALLLWFGLPLFLVWQTIL